MQEASNFKKSLFGVLRLAIQETQIQVTPKECSGKKKSQGLIKQKALRLLKLPG